MLPTYLHGGPPASDEPFPRSMSYGYSNQGIPIRHRAEGGGRVQTDHPDSGAV